MLVTPTARPGGLDCLRSGPRSSSRPGRSGLSRNIVGASRAFTSVTIALERPAPDLPWIMIPDAGRHVLLVFTALLGAPDFPQGPGTSREFRVLAVRATSW